MKQGAAPLPVDVSRETEERLNELVALLLVWNKTINLISRGDEKLVWQRHVRDSLALVALMSTDLTRATDLGSGAGFPGLVLAIATGTHFDLIEADQRKCAFLREAARKTAAPVTIHPTRIESARVPPAMLITARALAPLVTLLGWAAPLLALGGICLFPKGRGVTEELTAAAIEWQMRVERLPSATDPTSTILRISEIARVGPSNQ